METFKDAPFHLQIYLRGSASLTDQMDSYREPSRKQNACFGSCLNESGDLLLPSGNSKSWHLGHLTRTVKLNGHRADLRKIPTERLRATRPFPRYLSHRCIWEKAMRLQNIFQLHFLTLTQWTPHYPLRYRISTCFFPLSPSGPSERIPVPGGWLRCEHPLLAMLNKAFCICHCLAASSKLSHQTYVPL